MSNSKQIKRFAAGNLALATYEGDTVAGKIVATSKTEITIEDVVSGVDISVPRDVPFFKVTADEVEQLADAAEREVEHVVVPAKYKEKYAKQGNPNNCGDWLAKMLEGEFFVVVEGEEGKKAKKSFDHVEFAECLVDNDVDMTGKWALLPTSGQRGWVGRYRMNGRQKLAAKIKETRVLWLKGTEYPVPADF